MEVIHDEKNRIFYIGSPEAIAKSTYILRGNKMFINHTWVTPERRGEELAKLLVNTAVEYARKNSLKIVPRCSFVDVMARRYPENFKDVLEENS